jgi:hypothetical protein
MHAPYHPQVVRRWLPTRLVLGGATAGDPRRQLSTEVPETAVLQSVGNCLPLPHSTGAQGIILTTNLGTAILLTTDASVREQLYHTLHTRCGMALRDIGALHMHTSTTRVHTPHA